jgi:hypothetical protein
MLTALVLALAAEAPAADPRADLQRFSARLEERLAAACRPAEPMAFLSGLPETRFVYLDGIGAVLLLPPAPAQPRHSGPRQPAPELSVSGKVSGPQVIVFRGSRPPDLTDLESRIRETRKEAERMRAQAEAAFADAERQLMAELRPGPGEPSMASPFPAPWSALLDDAPVDTRTPDQVEKDVQGALVQSLLEDGPTLKTLRPTDSISVSVELVTRTQPWVRPKPARTVIVRAQKADLDAFLTGRLTRDDLLKRIQTKAY